jgi:hypothetical protein
MQTIAHYISKHIFSFVSFFVLFMYFNFDLTSIMDYGYLCLNTTVNHISSILDYLQGLVYTGFLFSQCLVYTGFLFSQCLVYTGFLFSQCLVYTGFLFSQGLVYTGFLFSQGLVYTGFLFSQGLVYHLYLFLYYSCISILISHQ